MSFLYDTYIYEGQVDEDVPKKPREPSKRVVDFDEVNAERVRIGKAAEAFALNWEKRRLEGCDLGHMVNSIADRRDQPGYGYDFQSFSSTKKPRYVEVKSVGRLPNGEGYRFFLSANEHHISTSSKHREEYYFYMVFFDGSGNPMSLTPTRAEALYDSCELLPGSFVVRFDL